MSCTFPRRRLNTTSIVVLALAVTLGCQRQAELGKLPRLTAAANIRKSLVDEGAATGEVAAAPTGTGWATLKGRFIYEGDPPAMPPYDVNKDHATCAPGGQAPPQEFLKVDSATKGVANIAIFPRKVLRVHETAGPKTEPVVFDQKECKFLTHVFAVTVGQPVEIHNSDPVGHNTSVSGQNTFNQMIPTGAKTPYAAKKEEAMPAPISCSVHPWMRAYLLPRKNAYFAVTAADGSFEIANLPAGEELEIQVWHETAPGGLFVQSDAAKQLKWTNKGRFKIKLEPDDTRELNVPVPASAFGG